MLTDEEIRALEDLVRQLGDVASRLVMVGAGARLLAFDRRYDLPHRSTTDWDFAVQMETWPDYEGAIAQLVRDGSFQRDRHIAHRVHHTGTATMIDLVPFGGLEEPARQLTWPDTNHEMSTLGLGEALNHAIRERIGSEVIRIATMPCFVALKLVAFADRPEIRHLVDVDHVAKNYADPNYDERVFDALSVCEELDAARPWLLGQDVRAQVGLNTLAAVEQVVSELLEAREHGPLSSVPGRSAADWAAAFAAVVSRFEMFRTGLRERGP